MRILIVKMSALGDVVHALPVLNYLQKTVPGAEIDWVVEESFLPILSGNPALAHIHPVRFKAWRKQPFSDATRQEIFKLWSTLRNQSYDLVLDLQGNIKSGLVTRLTGCPQRIGFDRNAVRELPNIFCTTRQIPLRDQDQHITNRSLRLVSASLGLDYSGSEIHGGIWTSTEDDAAAQTFLKGLDADRFFLIHNGTTWKTKLWHEAGWIQLGQLLLQQFPKATVLLYWGNAEEQAVVERIATGIGPQARLLPKLSIKGFTALIKQVDLMLGGDTGPIHIAASVGTPTVSLYRATDGQRNAPLGDQHRLVQAPLPCTTCLRKECERDQLCRESITPEMLMAAVHELIE